MAECEKNYGKHCFKCKSKNKGFQMISTGAGMDVEMLHEIGDRKIAISCSCCDGWLALQFTPEQISVLSAGKVTDINKISSEEAPRLIKGKDVQNYLNAHGENVSVEVYTSCNIPYP